MLAPVFALVGMVIGAFTDSIWLVSGALGLCIAQLLQARSQLYELNQRQHEALLELQRQRRTARQIDEELRKLWLRIQNVTP